MIERTRHFEPGRNRRDWTAHTISCSTMSEARRSRATQLYNGSSPCGKVSETRTSTDLQMSATPTLTPAHHDVSPPFPPLKPSSTARSAQLAAKALEDFAGSPENPRNWPKSKKWTVSLTVALTGFISTCGSSIGVPGIHAVRDEFGIGNEKIGVLITTFYVLGLG